MRRPTYLTTEPLRPFAEEGTYTARCRACPWERERLDLVDACAAALAHERDHEVPAS